MATAEKVVESAHVVEDVKELIEDTTQLVEDTAEYVVRSTTWFRNPKILVSAALLAGVAIGGAATYLVVRKKMEAKYNQITEEQIASVKEHYSAISKDGKSLAELASKYENEQTSTTGEVMVEAEEIIEKQGYTAYDKVTSTIEAPASPMKDSATVIEETRIRAEAQRELERNVFDDDSPDSYFNMEEELERREQRPNDPFVITAEEFMLGEAEYDQAELTYYDGDDVLADSKDQPVDDLDKIIGYENLLRFGHGSGDPMLVYIRNPRLELDFEVTHSDGKFAKEVLGFDDELSHSNQRRPRKFRDTDE